MTRALIILAAAVQTAANAFARSDVDTRGGERTFTVPLYPASQNPQTAPSHYWCSWNISEENLGKLKAFSNGKNPKLQFFTYDLEAEPDFPQKTLAELGLAAANQAKP